MGDDNTPKPNAEQEEAEELRRALQHDEIAPVDTVSFGKRVVPIIQRGMIAYWRKN